MRSVYLYRQSFFENIFFSFFGFWVIWNFKFIRRWSKMIHIDYYIFTISVEWIVCEAWHEKIMKKKLNKFDCDIFQWKISLTFYSIQRKSVQPERHFVPLKLWMHPINQTTVCLRLRVWWMHILSILLYLYLNVEMNFFASLFLKHHLFYFFLFFFLFNVDSLVWKTAKINFHISNFIIFQFMNRRLACDVSIK